MFCLFRLLKPEVKLTWIMWGEICCSLYVNIDSLLALASLVASGYVDFNWRSSFQLHFAHRWLGRAWKCQDGISRYRSLWLSFWLFTNFWHCSHVLCCLLGVCGCIFKSFPRGSHFSMDAISLNRAPSLVYSGLKSIFKKVGYLKLNHLLYQCKLHMCNARLKS